MKVKAKFIGKTVFISNGVEYSQGVTYTIEDTLYEKFKLLFEKIESAPVAPEANEGDSIESKTNKTPRVTKAK
jgi:hypothetical protein